MSKYQPESHAAKASAKRCASNGIGKGRGRAGGRSSSARNVVPLVSTWTLATATNESIAAGPKRSTSSALRAVPARCRSAAQACVSHDARGIAARTDASSSRIRNGLEKRRTLKAPRSMPPAARYASRRTK